MSNNTEPRGEPGCSDRQFVFVFAIALNRAWWFPFVSSTPRRSGRFLFFAPYGHGCFPSENFAPLAGGERSRTIVRTSRWNNAFDAVQLPGKRYSCRQTARLTWISFALSLKLMRFGRTTVAVFLGMALAAYVVDCSGLMTPDEAVKCCQAMPCSSSGHSQECCETMPQMHVPFVQRSSGQGLSFTHDLIAVLSVFQESLGADSSARRLVARCHAPPGSSPPTTIPIRT